MSDDNLYLAILLIFRLTMINTPKNYLKTDIPKTASKPLFLKTISFYQVNFIHIPIYFYMPKIWFKVEN